MCKLSDLYCSINCSFCCCCCCSTKLLNYVEFLADSFIELISSRSILISLFPLMMLVIFIFNFFYFYFLVSLTKVWSNLLIFHRNSVSFFFLFISISYFIGILNYYLFFLSSLLICSFSSFLRWSLEYCFKTFLIF